MLESVSRTLAFYVGIRVKQVYLSKYSGLIFTYNVPFFAVIKTIFVKTASRKALALLAVLPVPEKQVRGREHR